MEKNKEKVEVKGQKLGSKDSSRLIRNYKKREDAVKQGDQIFEEFRGVFLNCVQNRFAAGNPVVRNYIEHKLQYFINVAKIHQPLHDDRGILSLQDNIDAYKDRLFQSRIGDISGVSSIDLRNDSNIFTSQLISNERASNVNLIKSIEPRKTEAPTQATKTLDFKRKPVDGINKSNPMEIDKVSSRNDSLIIKEGDSQLLLGDDPFDFDAFNTIKKPNIVTESPNKINQNKSPLINFKPKSSGFKNHESNQQDLTVPLELPKEVLQNTNKSKFDFDFGSFQPVHQNANTKPAHQEEPAAINIQQIPKVEQMMSQPVIQTEPVQQIEQNELQKSSYYENNANHQLIDNQYEHVENNQEIPNYETAQQDQHLYGQFEQPDNFEAQPTYDHPRYNIENYNNQQAHEYNNYNTNNNDVNNTHNAHNNNQNQHYRIEVDKNVSSDEEFTYY